jgi:protein required for attachment to host cells
MTADRSGARIFERDGDKLSLLETITHEEGRLKDIDVKSDRPGRAFGSGGSNGGRAMATHAAPHEHIAQAFAHDLAEKLRQGRMHGQFTRLVIAAEPRFLGRIRDALDVETERLVVQSLPKDLQRMRPDELAPHVLPALRAPLI